MTLEATVDEWRIREALRVILIRLGYDPDEENLVDTPRRVTKWLTEYANGDPSDEVDRILERTFKEGYDELVAVHDISFTALCAHHLLPFTGKAHVAYIADGLVVGLSKLDRLVKYYAQRLTLQERITAQVADAIEQRLNPKGVMVVLQAEHGCMTVRGVKDPTARTTTSVVRGVFRDNTLHAKEEFLQMLALAERRP